VQASPISRLRLCGEGFAGLGEALPGGAGRCRTCEALPGGAGFAFDLATPKKA